MINLVLFLIGFLFLQTAYAEEYYYNDHKFTHPPEFCIIEFEDPKFPEAPTFLYEKTKLSIQEWENKLIESTRENEGWDFTFSIRSQEDYDNPFHEPFCDIAIFFEGQPLPEEEQLYAGYTIAMLGFADIRIFYLEPIYGYSDYFVEKNGSQVREIVVKEYKNNLDPNIDHIIKHEIGHALGLGHPKFDISDFKKNNERVVSPSIMGDQMDAFFTEKVSYEITDYDIQALVNLYGKDGINEFDILDYADYILIGIIVAIVVIVIKKKRKRRNPED